MFEAFWLAYHSDGEPISGILLRNRDCHKLGQMITKNSRVMIRDPRLAIGIGLVALCGLGGARILADADDYSQVWAASGDLRAGATLTEDDLQVARVRFASGSERGRYVEVTSGSPAGGVLTRDLGAGELVPEAGVVPAGGEELTAVSLSVAGHGIPSSLGAGDLVDVWVTPTALDVGAVAELAFTQARVLALPDAGGGFDPTAARQVVVGVDPTMQRGLPEVIGALASGDAVLTTRVRP